MRSCFLETIGICCAVVGYSPAVLLLGDYAWVPALFLRWREIDEFAVRRVRAALALATGVCILAVDFDAIFPKKFAKTRLNGYSLMDVGTGATIVSDAVARTKHNQALRLFGLGVARILLLESCDYPDNSEYGPCWNFFFTLAAVDLLSPYGCLFPLCVAASVLGSSFVAHPGIASLPGYAALHFAGKRWPRPSRLVCVLVLLASWGLGASRRVADPGYCLFVYGIHGLALRVVSRPGPLRRRRRRNNNKNSLLAVIDRNHSAWFLVANLSTGLCNLTIDTHAIRAKPLVLLILVAHVSLSYVACLLLFDHHHHHHHHKVDDDVVVVDE